MKSPWLRRAVRRPFCRYSLLGLQTLEDRTLLDASNLFAAFTGELTAGEQQDTVRVHLTSGNFVIGGGHATLGFLLRPGAGSGLAPNPVQISSVAPGNVPVLNQKLTADGGSLVLAKLKGGDFDIAVTGSNNTKGAWQLQIVLAGDVNGDFAVTDADAALIQDAVGKSNLSASFLVAADANLDGQITGYDLARAQENKGVSTTVRVLTVTAALDPNSDTGVPGDNLVNKTPVNVVGRTVPGALSDPGPGRRRLRRRDGHRHDLHGHHELLAVRGAGGGGQHAARPGK